MISCSKMCPNPQGPWGSGVGEESAGIRGRSEVRLYEAIDRVIKGDRPPLPEPSEVQPPLPEAERLMELTRSCWVQDQRRRPPMSKVRG